MSDWIALLIAAGVWEIANSLTAHWFPSVHWWRLVSALIMGLCLTAALVRLVLAVPPDADFTSGGYVYDQALFIEEGQRAVVMAGGAVITPVAFADSLNAIIMCESGNNPAAVNPNGGATGLLQLYPDSAMLRHVREHGYSWEDVTDPWVNIYLGYRWWVRTGGWQQWECRP